jgi:hypothetical protein
VEHCYKCHSATTRTAKGGLRLDSRDGLRKGGDGGPAVVPGDPDRSLLLKAVRHDGPKMPPSGKLPAQAVADLEKWVRDGAADPRDGRAAPAAAPQFWSFRPPRPHDAPAARDSTWPRSKVDHFVLARLEAAGLRPSPPAARRVWVRRVTFDLIGLPPTPEQVEAFVNDPAPDAERKVVERLLASPHYGERWARLWLDVARYAEDQAHLVGSDRSLFYPNAYLYRDWVIKALNDDVPDDRFVRLQLAADRIEGDESPNLAALGFLGLGPKYFGRKDPEVMADEWEDRVDVVTRGLLGLTVACARCHDHKFDPIPTEDYYALAGVFAGTRMFNRPLPGKTAGTDGKDTTRRGDARRLRRPADRPERVHPGRREQQEAGCPAAISSRPLGRRAASLPARQRSAGTGRGDRGPAEPTDRPRDHEPGLGAVLRPAAGGHAEQLRRAGPAADAPGTARRPGGAVRRRRLVAEVAAPRDRPVRDLLPSQRRG